MVVGVSFNVESGRIGAAAERSEMEDTIGSELIEKISMNNENRSDGYQPVTPWTFSVARYDALLLHHRVDIDFLSFQVSTRYLILHLSK